MGSEGGITMTSISLGLAQVGRRCSGRAGTLYRLPPIGDRAALPRRTSNRSSAGCLVAAPRRLGPITATERLAEGRRPRGRAKGALHDQGGVRRGTEARVVTTSAGACRAGRASDNSRRWGGARRGGGRVRRRDPAWLLRSRRWRLPGRMGNAPLGNIVFAIRGGVPDHRVWSISSSRSADSGLTSSMRSEAVGRRVGERALA
jgi:hypothetical protein